MKKSETQSGAEKMASVEQQINAHVPKGVTRTLLCPFCGWLNLQGQLLCCDDMRKAVIAVLSGKRMVRLAQEAAEHGC
jgi:hypothetical protein